jgi:hypothetical protein
MRILQEGFLSFYGTKDRILANVKQLQYNCKYFLAFRAFPHIGHGIPHGLADRELIRGSPARYGEVYEWGTVSGLVRSAFRNKDLRSEPDWHRSNQRPELCCHSIAKYRGAQSCITCAFNVHYALISLPRPISNRIVVAGS